MWEHVSLPVPTEVQIDIAAYLQYGPRRKIIEAFRGIGKSWITSAYVAWRLRMNPQLNFLVVSATKIRADDFSMFTMQLIHDIPLLNCLIPRADQRRSKVEFDVAPALSDHAPSVKSVGIYGQLSGSRADEIIGDDIEVPNNSMTQVMRDKLSEAVKEFDAIIKPGGLITYLGTPQTEQSIYNTLSERGYTTRIWPVRYPTSALVTFYGDRLAPYIAKKCEEGGVEVEGKPTDPLRFNEQEITEREASYGRSGFALQYMLDTSLADGNRHPLKLRDLIVMGVDCDTAPERVVWNAAEANAYKDLPCVGFNGDRYYAPERIIGNYIPYESSVMVIDPSGRGDNETSYAVTKAVNSMIYVPEAGGMVGGYDEGTLMKLVMVAKKHKVNLVLIESNFGDGMFTALIKPFFSKYYPVAFEEIRQNKQKELRIIDTLEPVMTAHRLVVDRAVIERDYNSTKHLPPEKALKYQLFYQLSHITKDRGSLPYDDRIDVLEMAVAYHTKAMSKDAEKEVEDARRRAVALELEMFLSNTNASLASIMGKPELARRGGRNNWLDNKSR